MSCSTAELTLCDGPRRFAPGSSAIRLAPIGRQCRRTCSADRQTGELTGCSVCTSALFGFTWCHLEVLYPAVCKIANTWVPCHNLQLCTA